jgi:hypothetical protein
VAHTPPVPRGSLWQLPFAEQPAATSNAQANPPEQSESITQALPIGGPLLQKNAPVLSCAGEQPAGHGGVKKQRHPPAQAPVVLTTPETATLPVDMAVPVVMPPPSLTEPVSPGLLPLAPLPPPS